MEWVTKEGKRLSVDDMDENHVRNAFKMLIKRHNVLKQEYNALINKHKQPLFQLKGDMAEEFNNSHPSDEYDLDDE